MDLQDVYLSKLKERRSESKAYRKFQVLGLEIAKTLLDEKHKALYIKLAKEHSPEKLLSLAKEIAEKKHIKNKGAYFMKILSLKNDSPRNLDSSK